MYVRGLKYTKYGRKSFGSAILISDRENYIDTVRGTKKNLNFLVLIVLLIPLKLISANFIGIILSSFSLILAYFITELLITLQVTNKRILVIYEFKHKRYVILQSLLFLSLSIYSFIKFLIPSSIITTVIGLNLINNLFTSFNLPTLVFHNFKNFFLLNKLVLIKLETGISSIIFFWLSLNIINLKSQFQEIHNSHINEMLIKMKSQYDSQILLLLTLFEILFFFIFKRLSIFYLIIFYFCLKLITKKNKVSVSLFGSSNRPLVNQLSFNDIDLIQIARMASSIFEWVLPKTDTRRKFPQNIIPKEAASYYETGLKATINDALKQANVIGLALSVIINSFVIIRLYNFVFENNLADLGLVSLILLGLIIASIAIFVFINSITLYQYKILKEESLLIGNSFIGRYLYPVLWILKGNQLEGTSVSKKNTRRLFHYDRINGIQIAWRRFGLSLILLLLVLVISFWASIGGIDLQSSFYILPFLFNTSISFLSNKANAELNFFIIMSFAVWISVLIIYPRIYTNYTPRLVLDIEKQTKLPIVFKNTEDYFDASQQFVKCLSNSSRSYRRYTLGRPGIFFTDIKLKDISFTTNPNIKQIYFTFGDNLIKSKIIDIDNFINCHLIDNMKISGEFGFPKLDINLFEKALPTDQLILKSHLELENNKENEIELKVNENLKINLLIKVYPGRQ